MAFIPSADRIVGEELIERTTRGGIVIPETAQGNDPSKQKVLRIKVLAIGPGSLNSEGTGRVSVNQVLGFVLSVGDVVLCNRYCNQLRVDGKDLRIFGPSDVLGIETE